MSAWDIWQAFWPWAVVAVMLIVVAAVVLVIAYAAWAAVVAVFTGSGEVERGADGD